LRAINPILQGRITMLRLIAVAVAGLALTASAQALANPAAPAVKREAEEDWG
jgi:hypothetical protein